MSLEISSARATTMTTAGQTNNPLIAWENYLATLSPTIVVDTGTEINLVENAVTGNTFDAFTATPDTGDVIVEFTFSSAQTISFAAIAAHNLFDLTGDISVEYSTNGGSSWNDCGCGSVTPTDNQAVCFYFADQSAADWRFKIENCDAETLAIGVMHMGVPITMPQRVYIGYNPPIVPTRVRLQSNVTEGGHLAGAAVWSTGSDGQVDFMHLTPEFVRGTVFKPFMTHFNEGNGFFWIWRPTKYGDAFFAWRAGAAMIPTNSGPKDYMSAAMAMRFYDDP